MTKKVAIIGSGFAGVSAYMHLNHDLFDICIFEQQKTIGGRTRSFYSNGFELDTGQHLLMQAYTETLLLLDKLNVTDSLLRIKKLSYSFNAKNKIYKLESLPYLPAPFHIAYSFLSFCKAISFKNRLKFIFPAIAMLLTNSDKNRKISAHTWLKNNFQNEEHFKYLWELLIKSIFNCDSQHVSAYDFVSIFRILFFKNRHFAKAIIPSEPLSNLFNTFEKEIKKNQDVLHTSKRIVSIKKIKDKITIVDQKSESYDFDFVILATGPDAINQLINSDYKFERSAILTIYFDTNEYLFNDYFLGFPEEKFEWLFNFRKINKKSYYSAVISNFNSMDKSLKEAIEEFKIRISVIFNIKLESILIIKHFLDSKATYLDSLDTPNKPKPGFIDSNLLICGDWTDTGLPCTIESAVISGKIISEKINLMESK